MENTALAQEIWKSLAGNTGEQLEKATRLLCLLCQSLVENGLIDQTTLDALIAEATRKE